MSPNKLYKFLFFLLLTIPQFPCSAQNRVMVDGFFADWNNLSSLNKDAQGDGNTSGLDFEELKAFNDDDYLFLSIETGLEINLQDFADLVLYIDIDNSKTTGSSINGIGADLVYKLGERSGTFYISGSPFSIRQIDIGLITAPTVTSERFEIAIKKEIAVNGITKSMANTIKLMFKDVSNNGDQIPSINGGIEYTFQDNNLAALPKYSIKKPSKSDLRIISYNVQKDGIFKAERVSMYTRILKAVNPDIIGFQEIYNNSSQQVANHIETMLPSAAGEKWHHAKANPDCHAISRYPILKSSQIPGSSGSGNGAFLIDLPNTTADILLIVAHPPCCSNNEGRQMEVDLIMQFLREAKAGKGPIPLQKDASIVILGDMNFVGDANQLETLITGDIANEATYGSDFTPDWDGNNLIDCKPPTTDIPFTFSWYSENSTFSPGRLDYILYSGSNLLLDNTYTLFTPGLDKDSLNTYKLMARDVVDASDHLPVVADFTLKNKTTTRISDFKEGINNIALYPNPTRGITDLSITTIHADLVTIELLDHNGKTIDILCEKNLPLGDHIISFNAEKYASGIYILKLRTEDLNEYLKLNILH